eukprot:scaffold3166_cov399-Prasinococcus_capsulatus_cf.AAC.6
MAHAKLRLRKCHDRMVSPIPARILLTQMTHIASTPSAPTFTAMCVPGSCTTCAPGGKPTS